MDNSSISKRNTAFGIALAIACVINALIVVVKEKSEAVMGGMKKLTGHHWTTHSVIVIVLFLGLGWLLTLVNGGRGINMTARFLTTTLVSAVAVSGVIIVGFYLFVD